MRMVPTRSDAPEQLRSLVADLDTRRNTVVDRVWQMLAPRRQPPEVVALRVKVLGVDRGGPVLVMSPAVEAFGRDAGSRDFWAIADVLDLCQFDLALAARVFRYITRKGENTLTIGRIVRERYLPSERRRRWNPHA